VKKNAPAGSSATSRTAEQVPRALTIELEAAVVRQLGKSYDFLNAVYFKTRLRKPALGLSNESQQLGRWTLSTRTLEVSRYLLINHGWEAVLEVVKHEMAHQFVDEVLGSREESSHGPEFRRVCEERSIDWRASGVPATRDNGENTHVLERIAKLLALAGSSNVHEAQAAMSAAQRLMLTHNIEAEEASAKQGYSFRHLGKPTGRLNESIRILTRILNDHFFVEPIWIPVWRPFENKRGSVLEICGTETNLDIAAYVYRFLNDTAERLWLEHRRANSEVSGRDRLTFMAGVMAGFREKLDEQRSESRGRGIVWVGDAGLGQYFKRRHPHVRTTRYATHGNQLARQHGRAAGKKIVLHRAVKHNQHEGTRLLNANNS